MKKTSFKIENSKILLNGIWDYKISRKTLWHLKKKIKNFKNKVIFDFSNLETIDYAIAVIIYKFVLKNNLKIEFVNSNKKFDSVFSLIKDDIPKKTFKFKKTNFFEEIGISVYGAYLSLISFLSFLGELIIKSFYNLLNLNKLRLKNISNVCKDAGINSVFIVSLTSFLIGIVLIYIGSEMLANFGVKLFIVEIMGMLTFRELSPLIAAIVIAGRSASSFTAQIGVMKITEEIDAMKTMGFDPFIYLVIPRILGMIIIMPFIIFLADMASILGQMIVSYYYLEIDFPIYFDRVKNLVEVRHLFVGLIKAPFFGIAIALIGCLRGLEVSGSTSSIGTLTTKSVVNAIFWVIMIDCLFAIFFIEVGL